MSLKSIARYIVLGVLFIIPFLPLYVANDMFFPFITSKGFAFRILIEIAAGAWVLLALADKKYRPRYSLVLALFAGYLLWMGVADFFAVNAHKAFWSNYERMDGWVSLVHTFIFFVLTGSVLTAEKLWKRWWLVVLGGSVLVSLHGLWQIFGLAEIHQGGARVDANFGNAIYFAVYLMFTVGIALWRAAENRGWVRGMYLALVALQVFLIFASATRGVVLALFGALVVVAIAAALSAGKTVRRSASIAVVLLVLLAGGFYLARDSAFVKNEPSLTRLATVFDSREFTVRLTLWDMAREGVLARPLTGWGQEGYNYVFNQYYRPSLHAQEPWFDRTHNTYLDAMVAGGIPAFLLLVVLLVAALRALYRSEASLTERLAFSGILVAYMLQAVTAFDNLFSYILLAAVLAMAHERSSRPIESLERIPEPSATSVGAIALPATLVVTIGVLWVVNVPSISAAQDIIKGASSGDPAQAVTHLKNASERGSFATQEIAEQMVTYLVNIIPVPSISNETKQATAQLALLSIEGEIARAPKDARIHLIRAQALRALGALDAYDEELTKALTLSPNKQTTMVQRGVLLWQQGNLKEAVALFTKAYELDTSFGDLAAYAAAGHFLEGDKAGGEQILMDAFGTTVVDQDILRFAYFDAKMYDALIAMLQLRVTTTGGAPEARLLLAQAYAFVGRVAEARSEIRETIAAHPEAKDAGEALLKELGG